MTLTELLDFAKSRELYPIHTASEACDSGRGSLFVGPLEEYFSAVKLLGARAWPL